MKTKIMLTIFLMIILSVIILSVALAQTIQPAQLGVSKGDVFEYSYVATWNSTDSSLPIPSDIVRLNETQGFKITITDISGTLINAEVQLEFRNGSTNTVTGFVDVESGSISLPHGDLLVAANLKANDKIYPTGGDETINYTSTKTYPSGNRGTNERLIETTSENHSDKTDVFFDQAKGVAVSSYYESTDTYGSETEIFTETITNTNIDAWAVSSTATVTAAPTARPTSTPSSLSETPLPSSSSSVISPSSSPKNVSNSRFGLSFIDLIALIAVIVIVIVISLLVLNRRRPKNKKSSKSKEETETQYLGTF